MPVRAPRSEDAGDPQAEARRAASRERRRTRRQKLLANLAVTLHSVEERDRVLAVAAEHARRLVGSRRAAVTRLDDGWARSATAVSSDGRDAAWRDPASVPRGPGPLDEVTIGNRPLRLNRSELADPRWEGLRTPGRPPLRSYLAVPLVSRQGTNAGLIQVSGKVGTAGFTDEEESLLVQLAEVIATAVERTETLERERGARAEAEEQAKLRGLLADAGKAFGASLEVDETLRTLTSYTLPGLADWCCIHLVDESGDIRLARADVAPGPHAAEIEDVLRRLFISKTQPFGPGATIRTGRSELFRRISGDVVRSLAGADLDPDDLRVLEASSGIIVPLRARGRTLGAFSLGRSGRAYRESELDFVAELASRAALALDNAKRYTFEREVAVTLQRSLLPDALPPTPALTCASRYLPGASGTEIGGDWYDLVALPDGRLGVVVGDVMGRGIPAAAVMAQLRATVRAYAFEGHEPAALLDRLDLIVRSLGEGQITTCLYGVLDPPARRLVVSSAGHLPPLIVAADGSASLADVDPNVPLGVGGRAFTQSELTLPARAAVVLYTDGLVEGRDEPADVGLAKLRAAASGPLTSPDELCDRLLRGMGRDGDHDDDTALLALMLDVPDRAAARNRSR